MIWIYLGVIPLGLAFLAGYITMFGWKMTASVGLLLTFIALCVLSIIHGADQMGH